MMQPKRSRSEKRSGDGGSRMRSIRVGIFGCMRGADYLRAIMANNGEIIALCDRNREKMEQVAKMLPGEAVLCSDFSSLLEQAPDAVLLANYFHEHASYAIACLERNIHVLSECTSNGTMAEGVALVRASEKSSAVYMLGENYPYSPANQQMRAMVRSGVLGKILYAEGEYNHPYDPEKTEYLQQLIPRKHHWRNFLPGTYYITHALAPLMLATGTEPIRVSAMPIYQIDPMREYGSGRGRSSIITCLNRDQSVFRVTGRTTFGAMESSFRFCGEKGQIENLRSDGDMLLQRFNLWDTPSGMEESRIYRANWPQDVQSMMQLGNMGAEFFVVRDFFRCVRECVQPEMDAFFATTMASVGILGHRSQLELGTPYEIPDFRKEEDRKKYETDQETPFWGTDGSAPTLPCEVCVPDSIIMD